MFLRYEKQVEHEDPFSLYRRFYRKRKPEFYRHNGYKKDNGEFYQYHGNKRAAKGSPYPYRDCAFLPAGYMDKKELIQSGLVSHPRVFMYFCRGLDFNQSPSAVILGFDPLR